MRRSSARSVALCAAVFLSACAALAAFETLSPDAAAGGSAAAVMRGLATGVGSGVHARLDSSSDTAQLSRVPGRRAERWAGALALWPLMALAAHGRTATRRGRRSPGGLSSAAASSRAPPGLVVLTFS